MTARELIASSLRLIGALAAGESLPASDGADALAALNSMLDAWRAERLTLYAQSRTVYALTGGQQEYTIGTGGDFNQPRPLWIDSVSAVLGGVEIPLREPYTRAEWASIGIKSTQSDIPEAIFYNPEFPLGRISVWPVPQSSSASLVLYVPAEALASVASLNTVISQPPGWSKALRYNLAVELAPEFGRAVDPVVGAAAVESLAAIKRVNELSSIDLLELDPALIANGRAWDFRTGEYR